MSLWEVVLWVIALSAVCYAVANVLMFIAWKRQQKGYSVDSVARMQTVATPEDHMQQDNKGDWHPVCDRCDRFVPVVVAYPRFSLGDAEAGLCGPCWREVHPQIFHFDGDPFAVRAERNLGIPEAKRFRGRP